MTRYTNNSTNPSTKVPSSKVPSGREDLFLDIDRMINEGLGGGQVTADNGLIEESTVETMSRPDSVNTSSSTSD